MEDLIELAKAQRQLTKLKRVDDSIELDSIEKKFAKIKHPEDLKMHKFLEYTKKHKSINLNDVNNLIDEIEKNVTMNDNIVELGDNKFVYFNNLNNFLYGIKDGKINNFNKDKEYEKKFKDADKKLATYV